MNVRRSVAGLAVALATAVAGGCVPPPEPAAASIAVGEAAVPTSWAQRSAPHAPDRHGALRRFPSLAAQVQALVQAKAREKSHQFRVRACARSVTKWAECVQDAVPDASPESMARFVTSLFNVVETYVACSTAARAEQATMSREERKAAQTKLNREYWLSAIADATTRWVDRELAGRQRREFLKMKVAWAPSAMGQEGRPWLSPAEFDEVHAAWKAWSAERLRHWAQKKRQDYVDAHPKLTAGVKSAILAGGVAVGMTPGEVELSVGGGWKAKGGGETNGAEGTEPTFVSYWFESPERRVRVKFEHGRAIEATDTRE